MSLFIFIFNTFLFTLHLYSMFLESTFDKLSVLEGFTKIYTFEEKKNAVCKFEPLGRRDCSVHVKSFISHVDDLNKTPGVLMLFRTLTQIFYVNTKYRYKIETK